MRISLACLVALCALPAGVMAQDASVHDKPAVRGSIIANLLQDHDNPFLLYPYESNYLLYTWTSDLNKEAIRSYDWAENARKDEVKFQLSLAFPLWRGILGDNSLLGASYTQKSWWQLSNSKESAPFRETNYEPQLFLGFATDYQFAGWTLRDIEMGYNHDSNGRSDPTSRSWNRLYARLMAQNGNWLVEVKPWYVVGNTDDNPLLPAEGGLPAGRGDPQRAGAIQLEHRLRRGGTWRELSHYQTCSRLYADLQRLWRVAYRL